MARRPGPHHLKVLQGTARVDRPAPAPLEQPTYRQLPDAPGFLDAHGVRYFTEMGEILIANRLLTALSYGPFCVLCALHQKLTVLLSAGELPPGGVLSQYRMLCCEFGMTPASQTRVGPMVGNPLKPGQGGGDPPAPGNRFAQNGAQNRA